MKTTKAFTFLELLIVIVLVFAVYGLFFSNFDLTFNKNKSAVSLSHIKTYLLDNFKFDKKLKLVCIEDGIECFVFVDDDISKKNAIGGLFKNRPEVYKYSASLELLDFQRVTFENQEDYEVCFEYVINKDRKSDEVIVSTDEKVYVFTAINDKPLELKYLEDVSDMFDQRVSEVRNAF